VRALSPLLVLLPLKSRQPDAGSQKSLVVIPCYASFPLKKPGFFTRHSRAQFPGNGQFTDGRGAIAVAALSIKGTIGSGGFDVRRGIGG